MKNENLQPSEALAKFFSPRREETPMLSAPEIEKLLAEGDMLSNQSTPASGITRRIIMSLSTFAAVGIAVYFAFFNGTHQAAIQPAAYLSNHVSATASPHSASEPLAISKANPLRASAKPTPRGPWSAGNDQIYADLSPEELARMGIVATNDTVIYYDIQSLSTSQRDLGMGTNHLIEQAQIQTVGDSSAKREEHYQEMKLTFHMNSLGQIEKEAIPSGVHVPNFFPVLITTSGGGSCMYRYEDGDTSGFGSLSDAEQDIVRWREWLTKPAVPGYHAFGYATKVVTTSSCQGCSETEFDTIDIRIGKDLPARPFPKAPKNFDSLGAEQQSAFVQLMHYYEGTGEKPDVKWPANLTINVDTFTAQGFRNELDSQENSSALHRGQSIFARINELVPVLVRRNSSTDALDSNDFIFWYEPSDELFAALPPSQAAAFRHKLAEPPQCLNAPEAVTSTAQVTYCVSEDQQVNVQVFDLMGHIVKSETQHAEAGDNIAKINTQTLPSGMYIILVQDQDGGQRTRRIWVQNANPK